jgi:RluA family pseudouridine synthase
MGRRKRPRADTKLADDEGLRSVLALRPAKLSKLRDVPQDLMNISASDYFDKHGLQYVRPYVYSFQMAFKARWKGRSLLDVFCDEFLHSDRDYWTAEMVSGRVLCNGSPASTSRIWDEGDQVTHLVHRHESPILSGCIGVVHEDDAYLVVNKPASVPCHPCGTYRKNSLVYLLAAMGWRDLRIVHRLDKQTSGIVVFAKSREHAQRFIESLVAKKLRKHYLARVTGRFPEGLTICNEALSFDEKVMRAHVDAVAGKDARTSFKCLEYDAETDSTLVACEPETGRTHQIRIHLQSLGHPIANDNVYNSKLVVALPRSEETAGSRTGQNSCELRLIDRDMDPQGEILTDGSDLNCTNCPYVANSKSLGHTEAMSIFLHALEYEGDGWKYSTQAPAWAGRSQNCSSDAR